MAGNDKAEVLGGVPAGAPLLSWFDESIVSELVRAGALTRIRAGEWLFREGDAGDALYVVEKGRLEVLGPDGAPDAAADGAAAPPIRVLGAGDVVGELALLCRAPRSASVRAVRDSSMLRVSHEGFAELLRTDTRFTLALLQALGEKLRSPTAAAPGRQRSRVFAVVPLDAAGPAPEVADALAAAVRNWELVACLTPGSVRGGEAEWSAQLDARERDHECVVLVGESEHTDDRWNRFCTRQADRVLAVVGDAPRGPTERHSAWDLVLCGRAAWPHRQRAWLDGMRPRAHHRLREQSWTRDVERLARRVTARSVGLVLSGGGARGLAHLGVLEVLTEAGVRIDRVGGTSMGALVASLLAAGRSPRELTSVCRTELVQRSPFRDYTWPRTALIRARRAHAMLERLFVGAHLDDLELECFCVSADLTTAQVVVHRRGSIADAVGASMSLPGLAPPVRSGGRLLVDGGVLNNVPADVMAATGEGPVIAVDVMARAPIGRTAGRMPSIIETLARASVMGSRYQAEEHLAAADAVISPDLVAVGLLEFSRFDEIVTAGRQAARHAVETGSLPGTSPP